MKKWLICIASAVCLMFTACQSEIEKREQILPLSSVMDTVLPIIQTHYDGILEEDYDKCFGVYAPFYQAAVADEWYYYNFSSEEEYIKGSSEQIKQKFGDDVTVTIEVADSYRLPLDEISDYKKMIKDIFEEGSPNITDGVEIVANVKYSGFIYEETEQTVWHGFLINDKWYIYDSYYEDVSAAFESEEKEGKEPEDGSNVIVIE